MIPVFAVLGATALYLTYIWLVSAVAASWLSERKGYGPKPGLASGLLLTFLGVIVWLVWPARPDSRWKLQGPLPRRRERSVAELRSEAAVDGEPPTSDAPGG
jgi:hypothetical protein